MLGLEYRADQDSLPPGAQLRTAHCSGQSAVTQQLSLHGKKWIGTGPNESFHRPTTIELIVEPALPDLLLGPNGRSNWPGRSSSNQSRFHTYLGSAFCLTFPEWGAVKPAEPIPALAEHITCATRRSLASRRKARPGSRPPVLHASAACSASTSAAGGSAAPSASFTKCPGKRSVSSPPSLGPTPSGPSARYPGKGRFVYGNPAARLHRTPLQARPARPAFGRPPRGRGRVVRRRPGIVRRSPGLPRGPFPRRRQGNPGLADLHPGRPPGDEGAALMPQLAPPCSPSGPSSSFLAGPALATSKSGCTILPSTGHASSITTTEHLTTLRTRRPGSSRPLGSNTSPPPCWRRATRKGSTRLSASISPNCRASLRDFDILVRGP